MYLINIGSNAFKGCKNLESIVVPTSLAYISEQAFYGCDSLTDIFYQGFPSQWNDLLVNIEQFNNPFIYANVHYLDCYLQIGGSINGAEYADTGNSGTFEVYLNGVLYMAGTTSCYIGVPYGTTYQITNCIPSSGITLQD